MVSRFAGFLRQESGAAATVDDPILLQLEPQQVWLAELKEKQFALLRKLGQNLETDTKRFHLALQNIGFAPEMFIARANATEEPSGRGGPLLSLPAALTDNGDSEYLAQLANAADSLDTLTRMNAVPWMRPIDADYGTASGFGIRRILSENRVHFRFGSSGRGDAGACSAPGTVIYAGQRKTYGSAWSESTTVIVSARATAFTLPLVSWRKVEEDAEWDSRLSRRSTGPHVHYEVWYGNSARDPQKFIKAGQFLLQE